jgi:hypothetical protein
MSFSWLNIYRVKFGGRYIDLGMGAGGVTGRNKDAGCCPIGRLAGNNTGI